MTEPSIQTRLPENAYRELKLGETYVPMVPPHITVPEVTRRSIVFGILMNVVFAMAATYLALKVGQGIETAIPISILAVGLSGFLARFGYRKSSLLENVNVLAISTTSGIVAGGTVFTMPAIYLLKLNESLHMSQIGLFLQIFLVPFLGAIIGVVFLVPFRGYFVRVMHGKLPFPEGTATNEILATGASEGGSQAWVLIYSFVFAMAYNFLSGACRLFTGVFTSGEVTLKAAGKTAKTLALRPPGWLFEKLDYLTHNLKAVLQMGTGAEYLGLGFIIGLRYATIICCGSFLSCFVIVPLFSPFSLDQLHILNPAVESTSAKDIFQDIPRIIGIGAIFTAGIISILKMSKVIATALKEAIGGLFNSQEAGAGQDRTDQDISYPTLLGLGLGTAALLFLYFRFSVLAGMVGATKLSLLATLVALLLSFLFTTVSAWAIAMISTTPLSGMTVTTIIITAVVLLGGGLPKGDRGMLAVLLVGGVVCTALSMAGTMVTQFKIAYWIGATPKKVQWGGIVSSLLASVLVTITIMVLAYKPGYVASASNLTPLDAPQANLMKSTLESFIGTGNVPWLLYGTGAVIAVIIQMLGISPLAFGLGMYLPMRINTPILVGAIVQALVARKSGDTQRDKVRNDKGILVASGLIAGAAIIDVLSNALAIFDEQVMHDRIMPSLDYTKRMIERFGSTEEWARRCNWLGLCAFLILSLLVYVDCRRAKVRKV